MQNGTSYERQTGSSLSPGTTLRGRYHIIETLGQGGYGITYSALDIKTSRLVAIKELFPSRIVVRSEDRLTIQVAPEHETTFQHLCDNFEEEARVLIELQNLEGVVDLKHVFSENNTVYYAMELLEGEDLMHRLKRTGPMPWEQLSPILETVIGALERVHAAGLIHRDISPDNIFLTEKGAYLIDFGSARKFQENANFTAIVKQNFAPWEQYLSNSSQGPWTDVYALAATMYFALTGQLPQAAMERKIQDKLVPLEHLCPGLPREVYDALQKGMSVSAEGRFHNMSQFRHALYPERIRQRSAPPKAGLMCLRGAYAGKLWSLQPNSALLIGRNTNCDICYPRDAPGVSRVQCEVFRSREGKFFVRDYDSRYGTRLKAADKTIKLEPGVWYSADGAHLLFGALEEFVFIR